MTVTIKIVPVKLAFKIKKEKNAPLMQKLISWWTQSPYVHVELIIDDQWVSSDLPTGGVTIQPLRELTDKWEYVDLGNMILTDRQYDYVMDFIQNQKDKKYDTLGIVLSQVLPWRVHSKDKWFCSEICTKLLQLLTVKKVYEYEPHELSPADLYRIMTTK